MDKTTDLIGNSIEMTSMYNVIPDLHADPNRLDTTLARLHGPLAFLGDFIDGKNGQGDDRAVLTRVRGLMDRGAVAVMGNHELNAILFHHGLREDNTKNRRQHESFLTAFGHATPEALSWTDWFLTLPLWLDLGGLRLVHACWRDQDIATIAARRPDGRLHPDDLPEIHSESSEFGRAVKRLVSGPEVLLPSGLSFVDGGGTVRLAVRLAWWRNDMPTWRDAVLSVDDVTRLPDTPLPDDLRAEAYPSDATPVLVGHYKMRGLPQVSGVAASLDYPATACAYRWSGEKTLKQNHLVVI